MQQTASIIQAGQPTPLAGSNKKTPTNRTRRVQQQKTPPEEKLKRIENDIGKRSAMQDLMYRQNQLEDAVKEARRVNTMIEEEKERMRQLKQRMLENNLAQYVTITKQEIKAGKTANKSQAVDSVEQNNSDEESFPGLIPPIEERRLKEAAEKQKKNKLPKQVTSENMFDDNYAFYMYYLNTAGQLVTPVEQMFQDNAAKQEQIRKLQEELEKKSRVVKPTKTSNEPNHNTMSESKDQKNKPIGSTKVGAKKPVTAISQRQTLNNSVTNIKVQKGQISPTRGIQSVPPPVKRTFLKRVSPAPPDTTKNITSKNSSKTIKNENIGQGTLNDSFERSNSKGQLLQSITPGTIQKEKEQTSQATAAKKFPFLKRPERPVQSPKALTRDLPWKKKKLLATQSQSTNLLPQILPDQTTAEEAHRLKSMDEQTHFQLHEIMDQDYTNKQIIQPKNQSANTPSKQRQNFKGSQSKPQTKHNPRYSSVDPTGTKAQVKPQILIKKSSTRMQDQQSIDRSSNESSLEDYHDPRDNKNYQSPRGIQNQTNKRSNKQNLIKTSIETTDSASTLNLPPLVKTSQLLQQTDTSSSGKSVPQSKLKHPGKPPKPSSNVGQNASILIQQMAGRNIKTSMDSITTLPSLTSGNLQSINQIFVDHQNQSVISGHQNQSRAQSSQPSSRGYHSTSQIKDNSTINYNQPHYDEKRAKEKAKRDKQIEYANEIALTHKPKLDPHKQMEIEIRQNYVSLDQMEIQQREHPIKKVQLSDLL